MYVPGQCMPQVPNQALTFGNKVAVFVYVCVSFNSSAFTCMNPEDCKHTHGCLDSRRSARTFRLIAPYAGLHLKL